MSSLNKDENFKFKSLIKSYSSDENGGEWSSQIIDENLKIIEFVTAHQNEGTQELYYLVLKAFFDFVHGRSIKEVLKIDAYRYRDKILSKKSKETQRNHISILKCFFSELHDEQYIEINPFKKIKLPRVDKSSFLKKLPSQEEIERLIELAENKRDRLLIAFLYLTGLRISEALSTRMSSFKIHKEKNLVTFPVTGKGDKSRLSAIPISLFEEFKELKKEDPEGFLFTNNRRDETKPISRNHVCSIFQELSKKAKLKRAVSPHMLRHAFATRKLEEGRNINEVKTLLGHEHLSTTGKYLHSDLTIFEKDFFNEIKG